MTTASKVVKTAVSQIGICESPANSNKQKYGRAYGWDGTFWCAQFVWWCGWKASGKNQANNPIAKSASAAYIHEETVKRGGRWILPQNGTRCGQSKEKARSMRKAYLKKAKPGDIVSFDFGAMDGWRDHVGIVEKVSGDYLICIEGNTSSSGSQSNGGMVCRQRRLYTSVCAATRPKYSDSDPTPVKPTQLPTLPKRGWLQKGDEGVEVKKMQRILIYLGFDCGVYDADGIFGDDTCSAIKMYEKEYGLQQDGDWGKECNRKAGDLLGLEQPKAKKKTKAEKIIETAVSYAYPAGTDKSKYAFKGGSPKDAYKKALDRIFPKHESWKKEIRTGASCAVFVATVIRSAGVSKSFCCDDPPKIMDHMNASSLWKKINSGRKPLPLKDLKPGDIIVYEKPGANGSGHILLYKGGGYQVEANFGRCYPHTQKLLKAYLNETYIKNTFKRFGVYRVKE